MSNLGDKIFGYSKSQLEQEANQFIRGRRPLLKPPICAELILARMPEVKRIEVDPVLKPKFKIEAMVLARRFMHRELTVVVDQEIMDQRDGAPYNMALAEEIAHIELHRAVMLLIEWPEDFLDIQRHPRWSIAEHDAKYFGRALLMPREMLEHAAAELYQQLASEIGFGDPRRFQQMFTVRIAQTFMIPPADAEKRIDAYVGGLRSRLDKSIVSGSSELLSLRDDVVVRAAAALADPFPHDVLWGAGNN